MATNKEIIIQHKLVEAAKRKPKMFKRLYEMFHNDIFYFILNRCHDEHLAADLCSKTFLKAMINLPKYEFKGLPFSAWLFRIASNELNLFYRSNNKNRDVSIEENVLPEIIEETEFQYSEESIDLLLESINGLDLEEVELLELRYFEKRSVKEVSGILGMSEANVKTKTHRVVKKLGKIMKAKSEK